MVLFFSLRNRPSRSRQALPIRGRAERICRPRLEVLEDRTAPATINWIGGSGDFNTAGNWGGGVVPGGER
jgi:hypothetical protein